MTSLLTNYSAMSALTTLKGLGRQLDTVSNRVSTGQRVSSAADDAAYWSIATAVRTDHASLSAVKDALGLGASAVDTAYQGLTSILSDLQTLRAKLQSALTPGVDRAKVQTEIAAIQSRMRAIADSSVSSGQNWLSVDSSASTPGYQAVQRIVSGFSRGPAGDIQASSIDIDVDSISLYDLDTRLRHVPGSAARVTAESALAGVTDFSAVTTLSVTLSVDGGAGQDILLNHSALASAVPDLSAVTPRQLVAAINNQIAANPALQGKVQAGLDPDNRLFFETTMSGSAHSLQINRQSAVSNANMVANGGFESGLAGWSASDGQIAEASTSHSGSKSVRLGTVGHSGTLTTSVATVPGQTYDLDFWLGHDAQGPNHFAVLWNGTVLESIDNDLQSQPFSRHTYAVTATGSTGVLTFEARHDPGYWFVDDVSLTAVGGLAPTLGFGSGATAQRSGRGSDPSTTTERGLLDTVDQATGMSVATVSIAGLVGIAGDAALQALITQMDRAVARVTDAGTRLGANKTQIDGQRTFVDTLMKVSDRTIGTLVDADIEEESTKLKALQTQQQLAMQTLSIANAASQTVVALFR